MALTEATKAVMPIINRLAVPDLPMLGTSLVSLACSVPKLRMSKYLPKWRRDLSRHDQGRNATQLAVPDLTILDTSLVSLACSIPKLRMSKYLPKMAT